jgi:hypothetical protein
MCPARPPAERRAGSVGERPFTRRRDVRSVGTPDGTSARTGGSAGLHHGGNDSSLTDAGA